MKNSIRYNGNINNTSVIIFLNRKSTQQKLPGMVLCLGEPPERFLLLFIFVLHFVVIFVLHFVVVVLHFISRLLCHVTGTPPLASKAREGLHQALSSTPTTLDSLLLFHLPQALRFWVGIYLPTGVFYLMLLHWHFSAFIKASWEPTVLPWSLQGFILIPRNTETAHLFVWFRVNHNLYIQKNSFLNSTMYYHELLVVKSLVYMLLICFKLFSLV